MSEHLRRGGGGGMHTSGYAGAHSPVGGGGDAGEPQLEAVKATTGWSSTPFGAAPSWPLSWSKNPTPVIVAVPLRARYDVVGGPHAARNAPRARRIFALAFAVAPRTHDGLGNSAIIVPP